MNAYYSTIGYSLSKIRKLRMILLAGQSYNPAIIYLENNDNILYVRCMNPCCTVLTTARTILNGLSSTYRMDTVRIRMWDFLGDVRNTVFKKEQKNTRADLWRAQVFLCENERKRSTE